MKALPLILACFSVMADDSAYDRVRDEVFWPKLYNVNYQTLYCAVNKRAGEKVTVEHVYPASWIAEANGCPNRNECPVDAYRKASSDLHNLWPALQRYNSSRGNLPFIEIPGEEWRWPEDKCDFERTSDGVEPRTWARGEIARSFLYMLDTYNLPDHGQRELMEKWNREDPVTEAEARRNKEISRLIEDNLDR